MPDPVSPCGPDFTFEECGFDLAETLLPSPQGECPEGGCPAEGFDANGNRVFNGTDSLAGATGALGPWGPGGTPGKGVSGDITNPTDPGPLVITFTGGTIPCNAPLGTNLGQYNVSGGGSTGPASYHADFVSGGESFSGWLDTGAAYSGPGYKNSLFTALPSSGKDPAVLYPVGKSIDLSILITILNTDGTPTTKTKTLTQTFTVVDTGNCGKAGGGGSGSSGSSGSEGSAGPGCGYEVWEWQEIGAKVFTAPLSGGYSSLGISDPYFSIKEIINGEVNINTATGVAVVGQAGQITAVTIINRGGGYATAPTISFSTGGGGAKFTAVLTDEPVSGKGTAAATYGIKSVFIDTPGSGLIGTETLKIGPGVVTTLVSVNGIAQSVTVSKAGDGFSLGKPPLVQIEEAANNVAGLPNLPPMTGEGATATSEITEGSKSVSKVIITSGGKNYSRANPPKVIFSAAPDVTSGCPALPGGKGPGKITQVCAPLNPRETLGLRQAKSAVSIVFDANADTQSKFKVTEKVGATGTVTSVGSGVANIAITNGGSYVYYEGAAIVIKGPGDIEPSNTMTTKQIENSTFVIHGVITDVVTEEEIASASLASSAAANPPPCDVGSWVKVQNCNEGCEPEDQNSSTFDGAPAKKYVRIGVPYKGVLHYALIPTPAGWTTATPPTIVLSTMGMPTNALNLGGTIISLSTYFNSGDRNPDANGQLTVDMVGSDGGMPYPPECSGPEGAMDTGGVGKTDNGLGASSKRRYPCVPSGAPVGYGEFTPIIKKIPPNKKKETPCKKGDCDKLFSTWMAQAVGPQDENNSFEVNWILLEKCPEPCVNSKPDSDARIVESTLIDIPCSCYEVEETPDDNKPKNDYGLFSWKKFFNK